MLRMDAKNDGAKEDAGDTSEVVRVQRRVKAYVFLKLMGRSLVTVHSIKRMKNTLTVVKWRREEEGWMKKEDGDDETESSDVQLRSSMKEEGKTKFTFTRHMNGEDSIFRREVTAPKLNNSPNIQERCIFKRERRPKSRGEGERRRRRKILKEGGEADDQQDEEEEAKDERKENDFSCAFPSSSLSPYFFQVKRRKDRSSSSTSTFPTDFVNGVVFLFFLLTFSFSLSIPQPFLLTHLNWFKKTFLNLKIVKRWRSGRRRLIFLSIPWDWLSEWERESQSGTGIFVPKLGHEPSVTGWSEWEIEKFVFAVGNLARPLLTTAPVPILERRPKSRSGVYSPVKHSLRLLHLLIM